MQSDCIDNAASETTPGNSVADDSIQHAIKLLTDYRSKSKQRVAGRETCSIVFPVNSISEDKSCVPKHKVIDIAVNATKTLKEEYPKYSFYYVNF